MTEPDPMPVAPLPYQTPSAAPPQLVVWFRLAIIVIVGFAIERGVEVLGFVMTFVGTTRPPGVGWFMSIFGLLPMFVTLGACWLLWIKAPTLAIRLTAGIDCPDPAGPDLSHLLTVGLIILGAYELTEGVAAIAGLVIAQVAPTFRYRTAEGWLPPLVRLAAGLWLVLGTRGVRQVIGQYSGRWKD